MQLGLTPALVRVRRLQPSDHAWITLGVGVLIWDACCGEGETLSEACDRWMIRHPWLVRTAAFTVAAHLCNFVSPKYDAIHWFFVLSRKWRHLLKEVPHA